MMHIVNTKGLSKFRGSPYFFKGLKISKSREYVYLSREPSTTIDLPASIETGEDEALSLCVHADQRKLIVVSTAMKHRLLRSLSTIDVTFKSPIVDVSWKGTPKEGTGPGPTILANRAIDGQYGPEVTKWLLAHIFGGTIAVNSSSPIKCFVPHHALHDDGQVFMTTPLPASLMNHFKIIRKRVAPDVFTYYWAPFQIGNVFELSVGNTMVDMEEISDDVVDGNCVTVRVSSEKPFGMS